MDIDVFVDFTDVEPTGHLLAHSDDARRPVVVGETLVIGDADGAVAKAVLTEVSPSGWLHLQVERGDARFQESGVAAGSLSR